MCIQPSPGSQYLDSLVFIGERAEFMFFLKLCSPPVLDPATVCVSKLPVPNVTILSLSADQLLLACVSGSSVQIFSLPHLLNHQSDAPVYNMSLCKELTHFSWCPDGSARDSTSFIAVTVDHVLLHGSLISGAGTLAEGVEHACWSPSGQHIAYSSGNKLVVTAPDWKETAFVVDIPPPEGESESDYIIALRHKFPLLQRFSCLIAAA